MLRNIKTSVKNVLNSYSRKICRDEFKNQKFTRFNERPVEFSFVFSKLMEIYPRTILDVGSGTTALPHLMRNCGFLVTATDNVHDYWTAGMFNRHYHVIDDDITMSRLNSKFDFITCVSVLEHIQQHDTAVQNMLNLLTPGGHLLLTFPYNEKSYVKNVYELPGASYGQGNSYITQSYSRSEMEKWLANNNAVILEQEYWQFWDGEHWTVGKQIISPKKVTNKEKHQLTCVLLSKN